MDEFNGARRLRLLAGCALMLIATFAQAQYVWVDEKGIKQFSDRPPPPSTPAGRIIKQPGADAPATAAPASAQPAAAEEGAPKTKGPSLAERDAGFRKRLQEKAELEKKDAEAARQKADRAENCEQARQARLQLESGRRLSTYDKNGERGLMNDEQRAQQEKRVSALLEGCK